MKWLTTILITTVLTAAGCTAGQQANANNTAAAPAGDNAAFSPTATPANVSAENTAPDTLPTPADETAGDNADFAGTAGITEKKNAGIKAPAVMRAVRAARHGNYDRVVFEFEGAELPTYHIEYIDKPVHACGSGHVVPLAGDGWLEVRFTDAYAHTPEGQPTIAGRERKSNLPVIKEMKMTCDFEAEVTWVLGMASPNKYRVIELKDPTRLAVDIKH